MSAIQYFEELNSTNSYIKEHAAVLADKTMVVAQRQTNGKGRTDRRWESGQGGLYCSLLLKEPFQSEEALPLYIALAVVKAVKHATTKELLVKWPNDLLLNYKKVCGILCEHTQKSVICGIGVNLVQPSTYFTQRNLPYASSIKEEAGVIVSAKELAPMIYESILENLLKFQKQGFQPFASEYRQKCVNIGKKAIYQGREVLVADITERGYLVIEVDGEEQVINSGEIHMTELYEQFME